MKRIVFRVAVLAITTSLLMVGNAISSDCSSAMVDAMLEEGLTREQVNRICLKAAMKEEGLSDEQISRIVGKTEAMPAVSSQAAPTSAPTAPAKAAPIPAPASATPPPKVLSPDFPIDKIEADIIGKCVGGILGWCFEKGEYREIEILETNIDREKAEVIFYVKTIKNHSGRLIAEYRQVAGKWKLDDLDPLDFD